MDKLHTFRAWLVRAVAPLVMLSFASAAIAQQEIDPPGRVAALTQQQGTVVFAPEGENEWTDLPPNRPLTRGDRVWTDRGSRAELHLGATSVHMDSQSQLAFFELDDDEAQLSLTQGTINVRVRDLMDRENVEVDTPNLAVRAAREGDYRIDVDPADGTTRVWVRSGEAIVYGQGGASLRLHAGQQATFEGRDLRQVRGRLAATDDFDRWAADLNRREDQSVSARYIPRQVIGYQELDAHGSWSHHESYGPVWYPRVTVNDWAPYRYGRWTYIRPWGWTWIDEAPWGFAPFHYGRWAVIGSRWAWVPGRFGPRPVYAPALVAFVGGGSGISFSLNIGTGPGIGWYPLAPGEAWFPTYRTTNIYITNINRNIVINRDPRYVHVHRQRADAWTSVRIDDFNRGRSVRENWRPVRPADIANAQVTTQLPRPDREERGRDRDRTAPRLVAPPPAVTTPNVPSRNFTGNTREERQQRREVREERKDERRDAREERKDERRDAREERKDDRRDTRPETRPDTRQEDPRPPRAIRGEEPRPPLVRDDARADEARRQAQERLREQQLQREQVQREQQQQRDQQVQQRAREEQAREQRERAARQQQERTQREQSQREQAQREQAARQQQEQRAQQRKEAREQQEQRQQEQRPAPQQRVQRDPGSAAPAAREPRRDRPERDDDDERKNRGRNG